MQDLPAVQLPSVPAVCVNANHAAVMSEDGEIEVLNHERAKALLNKQYVLVCHAPYTRGRLGTDTDFFGFDVLELFAFVHPTRFCVPTPVGLCEALNLSAPGSFDDYPMALLDIARALLEDLRQDMWKAKADPLAISEAMGLGGKGWAWTSYVHAALGQSYDETAAFHSKSAMNVWKHLPEWGDEPPPPPPSHHGVSEHEAQERLVSLLGEGAEKREQQMEYSAKIAEMFTPVDPSLDPEELPAPHVVLAEAGTGIGKTMGYLAPASVWAEKNQGAVWVSTYTKNLQRQIDQELDRLYPSQDLKDVHVAIRKGRENYLCLLNLEDKAAAAHLARSPDHAIAAGIMARWAAATKDGDLSGGNFPGWLSSVLGYQHTLGLADRRGECIFSACDHYHRCFVEHSIRKSKHAKIVVANHALAMIQAAMTGPAANGGEDLPSRYIFDEGHHLFDAADSAFSAHLTARETRDLRRWILGAEGGKRTRARGLAKRVEDLLSGDDEAEKALQDILIAAQALSAEGWGKRLQDGQPSGPCEQFLAQVYAQVFARAEGRDGPYSLETGTHPVDGGVLDSAVKLRSALTKLLKPMKALSAAIQKRLNQDQGEMEPDTRKRLDAVAMTLERRGKLTVEAWVNMLASLENGQMPEEFVDWMEIERSDGRAVDIGLYRHFVDPMKAFSSSLRPHLHGIAVTSATLRDGTDDDALNWSAAQERSGAHYLTTAPKLSAFKSPYSYQERTKVFVLNDVRKDNLGQVAGAYQALFEASGGGALGLFTAIQRLRAVHGRIASALEGKDIPLYAQHVDEMDTGTLVDIFRDDEDACLLGTDAIRDGVDVPGNALRLIVFDRVPWPRPNILHKARREAFGARRYDEMLARLKLKQAYGRLIRRAGDKGVFVMLDSMLPSRLHGAFPEDVEIVKLGLSEACSEIKAFLSMP